MLKTATQAFLSNMVLFILGVLIQQTVLSQSASKRIIDPLVDTSIVSIIPLAYFALPIVILGSCLYCIISYFRYERRQWKLTLGLSAPGMIFCSAVGLFNIFLCCALVT